MECLSKTCPVYQCDNGDGWVSEYQHNEVEWDAFNDGWYTCDTNEIVVQVRDRPAQWWCVGVYETDRAYGGPEEGGWWYSAGWLVEHAKIRFFDNYKDAYAYSQELWLYCLEENKDRINDVRLAPRGFTEQMPDTQFPKNRPYYS